MKKSIVIGFLSVLAITSAGGVYWWYVLHMSARMTPAAQTYKTQEEERDIYTRFSMEVYDVIVEQYWQVSPDADLAELYRLSLAKAAGDTEETLPTKDRAGVATMLAAAFERTPEEKRKALAVDTNTIALANLPPQGRSGLLSEKQEQQFRDVANNINRDTNLYATLGVQEGASVQEVQVAYEEKAAALVASSSPQAQELLQEVERAKTVLADTGSKAIYDETKIEPSLVGQVIGEHTLYVDLSKVTPATLQEFINTLEKTKDNPKLTALMIDVRGNIGGTLDFAKYLLALFIGPNQYAFDLFHQGELQVERTPAVAPIGSLKNFKEIAILVDSMTQSTAELTSAMFKRLNMAQVVGTRTRGWGSVENTFPLTTQLSADEKYSVLLVHSMTLREDNEPIEGRGVDPSIDTSVVGWEARVKEEFRTAGFAAAIINAIKK